MLTLTIVSVLVSERVVVREVVSEPEPEPDPEPGAAVVETEPVPIGAPGAVAEATELAEELPGRAAPEVVGKPVSVAVTGQMVVYSVVTVVTTVESAGQLVIVAAQLALVLEAIRSRMPQRSDGGRNLPGNGDLLGGGDGACCLNED